jgi:CHASE3 domain sensor protein
MFNNKTTKFRILLGYSVPILLLVLVSLAVYASLMSYKKAHWQTNQSIATFNKSQAMFLSVANLRMFTRGYLLLKKDRSINNYNDTKKRLQEISLSLSTFIKDEQQRELLARILEENRQIVTVSDELISLVKQGNSAEALAKYETDNVANPAAEISELGATFDQRETALLEAAQKEEETALANIGLSLLLGVVATLTLSVISGLLIANGITRYVGSAINAMSSTATEIAATVSQHERTVSQQAAMVNETTATIQELGVSSRQTSEQASSAAEVAQRSLRATEEGTGIVQQAIDGMDTLGAKVGLISERILKLGEQTSLLGNLANMVKDLSGEINMLALNAAVEAARAGEHGKGFAVVAGEIRKLAKESKRSAEQSNTIISEIQKTTNATILGSEEGAKVVGEVTGLARNVGALFDSLSESANNTYENAQQVMLNAKQQGMAIGQVVEAMTVLNSGARETAAGILQTKAGVDQLKMAAGNLRQIF